MTWRSCGPLRAETANRAKATPFRLPVQRSSIGRCSVRLPRALPASSLLSGRRRSSWPDLPNGPAGCERRSAAKRRCRHGNPNSRVAVALGGL
jgi:hypothetical protein